MKLLEIKQVKYNIACDIDGVLSNFSKGVEKVLGHPHSEHRYETEPEYRKELWTAVKKHQAAGGELWYDLELMDDAKELWNYIKKYNPTILSSTGTSDPKGTRDQKCRWISKHFGLDVKVITVDDAKKKKQYAKENYILIDDKEKALDPWKDAGGIGILHTSTSNTIKQLKKLGL